LTPLKTLFLTVLCLAAVAGCARRPQVAPPPQDPAQALDQALADLKAQRFKKAADRLTAVIFNFPGTRQASDAQFYLGECYFQARDYAQAQTEFDFYLQNFPNGRFQEEASFKLALSYLRSAPDHTRDQTRVIKARTMLTEFLASYPDSRLRPQAESALAEITSRLMSRELAAARLYFKAGEYRSALVYYHYIKQSYPESLWSPADRHRLAVCYLKTQPPAPQPLPEITSPTETALTSTALTSELPILARESVVPPPVQETTAAQSESVPHTKPELALVHFDTDRWDISAADTAALNENARLLKQHPELKVVIVGHCDPRGTVEYNLALGQRRADAVKSYLVKVGVPEEQLTTRSAGESQPISTTPADYWQDRRVELHWR